MKPSAVTLSKRPHWMRSFCLAGVVAFQFLGLLRGLALDAAKTISQFNCRNWTRQNGLPNDKISCLAQSKDGYLWLGTEDGLVRFDGQEFKSIPVELTSAQGHDIRNLVAGNDGRILFNIVDGGFGAYDGNKFSVIGGEGWFQSGMESDATTIFQARDGAIWTATAKAVDRWSVTGQAGSLAGSTNTGIVISICEDAAGRVWLGTAEHGLFCWADGKLAAIHDESLTKQNIFALAAGSAGQLWVGTAFGLEVYANGQATKVPGFNWRVTALLVDHLGILWVGTPDMGLARYEKGKFIFLRKTGGLASDYVTSLCEDAEGSLWVGTRDGLSQLFDVKFPVYSVNEGIGGGSSHSVAASKNGGLWIGTDFGLCYFDGTTATNYTAPSLLPNAYVKLCFEARNGDVYAEDGEKNVNIISHGHLLARLTNSIWVSAITEDSQGVLVAVGTSNSLFRVQDGKLNHYRYKVPAPDYYWINNLFVANDGAIWVASKNGVFRLQDGAVQHWSTTNGLSGDNGLSICQDAEGSIWVGLSTGIARIKDGQVKNIKTENGLADSWIYAVVPDDSGWFWFASSRGLFRVPRTELNDFADGKVAHVNYELFNGLEAVKSTGRTDQEYSACKTMDGRIWLPCPWGVMMIDPAHIPTNSVAPPVHINLVLANGKEFARAENIIVPPGRGGLKIEFAGLSFVEPEKIQFRYQLEGFDTDWVSSEGRHQAFYTNLKPGRYVFRVIAANADGVWNRTGDSITIELRPHFQQTILFYSLFSGLVLALLVGIYLWRVRRLKFKQRELEVSGRRLETEVRKRTAELAERTQLLEKEIEERKRMELEIERVHRELLETSRQAGMAEVAASVLHNIGNVLNSVNVSATLVTDQMKQSNIPDLGKVAALVTEHAADLAGFLTAHPQGRHLPNYLNLLAGQLAREQHNAILELGLLRQNIEHIKDIVAMQQNYARISGVTEAVQASELVEDALRMNAGALARHEIEVVREYADLPLVVVEKHKVLQILVNLISNAKYACDEAKRKDNELIIRVGQAGGGIEVSVQDNGIGIPAANLTRIFSHGFTTRKGGHGFGLHSGALAARELGGSLTVYSEGPGQGARFTLTLPLPSPKSVL